MDIAKPRDGFNIIEPDTVKAAIASHAKRWPRIHTYWTDIKALLKQAGHLDGERVRYGPPGARVQSRWNQAVGLPTIKVAYTVLGDTLHIFDVLVEE
jgi:hypothetical protein